MTLETIDIVIIAGYALALLGIALFVSREPAGHKKDTEDYFLAGRALPWWAIGASLIASNISAEQIIGQSGQGFAVGVAIAAYEWQAAIVLLIVAKFFLPIFLKRRRGLPKASACDRRHPFLLTGNQCMISHVSLMLNC